jgi:hypothetical protein
MGSELCENGLPGVVTDNQTSHIFVSNQVLLKPNDGNAIQLQLKLKYTRWDSNRGGLHDW